MEFAGSFCSHHVHPAQRDTFDEQKPHMGMKHVSHRTTAPWLRSTMRLHRHWQHAAYIFTPML